MEAIFFAVILFVFLGFIHPYTTYPLSLIAMRRVVHKSHESATKISLSDGALVADVSPSSVAILFCARNEESVIDRKIDNLKSLNSKNLDITIRVFNDASTDSTAKLLEARSGCIKLLNSDSHVGKSVGMNSLMKLVTEEYAVFTDANTFLDRNSVINAVRYLNDNPEVGLVAGISICANEGEAAISDISASYWSLDVSIKRFESDLAGIIGADGAFFVIRSQDYKVVPSNIIDDFFTSLSVSLRGKKAVQLENCLVYERNVTDYEGELQRKTRIACRAYNCYRLLKGDIVKMPFIFRYCFFSHKWLRWHSFSFLASCLLLSTIFLWVLAGWWFMIVPVSLSLTALASLIDVPLISAPWRIVTLLYAVNKGVWKSYLGESFTSWNPDLSAR